jgi:radical SAM superfamily enzyme YgiQ (UPF0313 family)
MELVAALGEAGFTYVTLPFESATQRILDRFATAKWVIADADTEQLFGAFSDAGIRISGNYMIGYPDETPNEIFETVRMARRHVDQGLDYALFFTVVPFPGSALFNWALKNGKLAENFDPDAMLWTRSTMRNLPMEPSALEHVRQLAWLVVNRTEHVDYKRGMLMQDASPAGPMGRPAAASPL